MILNQVQAEAIYAVMRTLQSINGKLKVTIGDVATNTINVFQDSFGDIHVALIHMFDVSDAEVYQNQDDFADSYKIPRG